MARAGAAPRVIPGRQKTLATSRILECAHSARARDTISESYDRLDVAAAGRSDHFLKDFFVIDEGSTQSSEVVRINDVRQSGPDPVRDFGLNLGPENGAFPLYELKEGLATLLQTQGNAIDIGVHCAVSRCAGL